MGPCLRFGYAGWFWLFRAVYSLPSFESWMKIKMNFKLRDFSSKLSLLGTGQRLIFLRMIAAWLSLPCRSLLVVSSWLLLLF